MDPPLHSDFRYGRIRGTLSLDRADEILSATKDGTTCLHLAATCGGFAFVPKELLVAENLLCPDERGDTPLHLAAFTGRLKDLPLPSLDHEVFSRQDGDGSTVIDIARKKNHVEQLPHDLLASLPFYQRELVVLQLRGGNLKKIPEELWSLELWSESSNDLHEGGTLYHEAARFDVLDLLPESMLKPSCWRLRDHRQSTPAHIICAHGKHDSLARLVASAGGQLPWLQTDENGDTLLHSAAKGGLLAAVPDDILDEANLGVTNREGQNVVDLAHWNQCLDAVPERFRFLCNVYARERLRQALTTGVGGGIPSKYFSEEHLNRLLPATPGNESALELVHRHGTYHLLSNGLLDKIVRGAMAGSEMSPVHAAAAAGTLDRLPERLLTRELLQSADASGKTPLHLALAGGFHKQLPDQILSSEIFSIKDARGVTGFHLAAALDDLGLIPVRWFTREVLLTKDVSGRSVADVAWGHGHTKCLPEQLRDLSKCAALERFRVDLQGDYVRTSRLQHKYAGSLLSREEISEAMQRFVCDWAQSLSPPILLDPQQAETVAQITTHVQVTARAGSGKTRSLVTRALFLIKHCAVDPRQILILAFNRKAVAEVWARLAEYLEEHELPHVLTFHSLAWRVVRPSEDILYDGKGSDEEKRLSQAIQEIIRGQIRDGALESDIRELMRINWGDSLARIIQNGFDLPEADFIALRERMHETTLDGRRVETEAHKHIGDFLVRHGIAYSYRPTIWRQSGKGYSPAFVHKTSTGRRVVIEAVGKRSENPQAAHAFWASDRASSSVRVTLDANDLASRKNLATRLRSGFNELGVELIPLDKEALWQKIRDKVIDSFTKSVQGFISRCQKECLWPDVLANQIEFQESASELQSKFWGITLKIFRLYEEALGNRQTDFDRLMLGASERIGGGRTVFSSAAGKSDLRNLSHILIDEFQDFSLLFDKLRAAMVRVNPGALYFCVGDDWQAINRFAGSNLRYFSGFTEEFKPSQTLEITTNYRSASRVVDVGNQVMEGHGVPSKPKPDASEGTILLARSAENSELNPEEEAPNERFGQLAVDILRLVQMPGMPLNRHGDEAGSSHSRSDGRNVAVLTRMNSIPTPNGMCSLEQWQTGLKKFLRQEDRERIEFSTIHGYKGREATAVILVEPEIYPLIHPDAVFDTIFGDSYKSLLEDERRLFYVGVTRSEEVLVLLQTNPDAKTEFIHAAGLDSVDVSGLRSELLIGDEVIVSLRNAPSVKDLEAAGTMPLKEVLKAPEAGFAWKPEQGAWVRRLPIENLPDAAACQAYLGSQAWLKDADQVIAKISGDEFSAEFLVTGGQLQRIGARLSESQYEELDSFTADQRKLISSLLEHLHLDLGLPWPEFGYEGTDANDVCDGSLLTIAWPDRKSGVAFPGDPFEKFAVNGWEVQQLNTLDRNRLIASLSAPDRQRDRTGPDKTLGAPCGGSPRPPEILMNTRSDAEGIADPGLYRTNVAGVTFEGRGVAIATLRPADPVTLKRCPDHPADPNAIEVFAPGGGSLGYIPATLASSLAAQLDQLGGELQGHVTTITPEQAGGHLSLRIEFRIPADPSAQLL